jgi:hypothetical protein
MTTPGALPDAAEPPSRAQAVLAANWRGGSTVPSLRRHPHQWGWDAAYVRPPALLA